MPGKTMRDFEKNDIRLAGFFLYDLLLLLKPFFTNELSIRFDYKISGNNRYELIMALIENVPNPNFGKPPCCFSDEIITLGKNRADDHFTLHFERQIELNEELRSLLRELKKSYEAEDGMVFGQSYSFSILSAKKAY